MTAGHAQKAGGVAKVTQVRGMLAKTWRHKPGAWHGVEVSGTLVIHRTMGTFEYSLERIKYSNLDRGISIDLDHCTNTL